MFLVEALSWLPLFHERRDSFVYSEKWYRWSHEGGIIRMYILTIRLDVCDQSGTLVPSLETRHSSLRGAMLLHRPRACRLTRADMRSTDLIGRKANRLARVARPLNARSSVLPTISCGGWTLRKRSDSASRHRIDCEARRLTPSNIRSTTCHADRETHRQHDRGGYARVTLSRVIWLTFSAPTCRMIVMNSSSRI